MKFYLDKVVIKHLNKRYEIKPRIPNSYSYKGKEIIFHSKDCKDIYKKMKVLLNKNVKILYITYSKKKNGKKYECSFHKNTFNRKKEEKRYNSKTKYTIKQIENFMTRRFKKNKNLLSFYPPLFTVEGFEVKHKNKRYNIEVRNSVSKNILISGSFSNSCVNIKKRLSRIFSSKIKVLSMLVGGNIPYEKLANGKVKLLKYGGIPGIPWSKL